MVKYNFFFTEMYALFCKTITNDRHLGCFYLSTTVNSAAMNRHLQVFVWTQFWSFWGATVGSCGNSMVILRTNPLVFHSSCIILHSNTVWGLQLLYIFTNTCYFVSFYLQNIYFLESVLPSTDSLPKRLGPKLGARNPITCAKIAAPIPRVCIRRKLESGADLWI